MMMDQIHNNYIWYVINKTKIENKNMANGEYDNRSWAQKYWWAILLIILGVILIVILILALMGVFTTKPDESSGFPLPEPPSTVIVAPSPNSTSAIVAFGESSNAIQANVTSYTAITTPDNIKQSNLTSPIALLGLRPRTEYTIQVYATGPEGDSQTTFAQSSITISPPLAPINVTATKIGTTIVVTYNPPQDIGNTPIERYLVNSIPHNVQQEVTSEQTQAIFTAEQINRNNQGQIIGYPEIGLTPGTEYTFIVRAYNAQGESPASFPTQSILF